MQTENDVCQSCGRGAGCNCDPIVRTCDCCGATFPGDEGQLGDICAECGWECDFLEEECECGSNDYSSANHECIKLARLRHMAKVA
jgi:hypothetical protein